MRDIPCAFPHLWWKILLMGQMTMPFLRINVLFKAFIILKLRNDRKKQFHWIRPTFPPWWGMTIIIIREPTKIIFFSSWSNQLTSCLSIISSGTRHRRRMKLHGSCHYENVDQPETRASDKEQAILVIERDKFGGECMLKSCTHFADG